jgi:hypothetical protein
VAKEEEEEEGWGGGGGGGSTHSSIVASPQALAAVSAEDKDKGERAAQKRADFLQQVLALLALLVQQYKY